MSAEGRARLPTCEGTAALARRGRRRQSASCVGRVWVQLETLSGKRAPPGQPGRRGRTQQRSRASDGGDLGGQRAAGGRDGAGGRCRAACEVEAGGWLAVSPSTSTVPASATWATCLQSVHRQRDPVPARLVTPALLLRRPCCCDAATPAARPPACPRDCRHVVWARNAWRAASRDASRRWRQLPGSSRRLFTAPVCCVTQPRLSLLGRPEPSPAAVSSPSGRVLSQRPCALPQLKPSGILWAPWPAAEPDTLIRGPDLPEPARTRPSGECAPWPALEVPTFAGASRISWQRHTLRCIATTTTTTTTALPHAPSSSSPDPLVT